MSAPPPLTNDLRENSFSCRSPVITSTCLCHHGRGLLDRGQDPRIGPTAAEMPVHRRADLVLGRVLRRREQVGGLDHHAVLAVAAMRHLHIDPRLLQRMQRRRRSRRTALCAAHRAGRPSSVVIALPGHRSNRRHTRPDLLAVQEHRAGTTLRKTATKARAMQVELVVQNVKERSIKARLTPCVSPFTLILMPFAIPPPR